MPGDGDSGNLLAPALFDRLKKPICFFSKPDLRGVCGNCHVALLDEGPGELLGFRRYAGHQVFFFDFHRLG